MRSVLAWSVLVVVAAQDPQGKRRAPPPEAPPALPPVEEPFRTPVERRDLLQRYGGPSPLEGHYSLKRIVAGGRHVHPESVGYLVLGRRHMSLHLRVAEGGKVLSVQSGYRRYAIRGTTLTTFALIGHSDTLDDDLQLEQRGFAETRELRVLGATLRIGRGENDYFEFVRLE